MCSAKSPSYSPASGYITERNALPNAYVQPDTKLYTIADLSTVWVYANVFQTDVGRLKPGDTAQVTVDAYPGRTFHGRIDQILPDVDPATRTVRVRLVFSNPGLVLKPGMYVQREHRHSSGTATGDSRIRRAPGRHARDRLYRPRAGQSGTARDPNRSADRRFRRGPKGLKPGDRIVSSANFLVDSEAQLQSALGSFSPLPQPRRIRIGNAGSTVHAHRSQHRIHRLRARAAIRCACGSPAPMANRVTGAQVTATFFMPAMPAMGMGAMRAVGHTG